MKGRKAGKQVVIKEGRTDTDGRNGCYVHVSCFVHVLFLVRSCKEKGGRGGGGGGVNNGRRM
jgi:hypothetical protein